MDYKKTLNLPKTEFPMKAELAKRESEIAKTWETSNLYQNLLKKTEGSKKFILHDGPPYANGSIHIGHALNKILKDIIVKYRFLCGYNTPFIPGWDCRGLPIEHQVMKDLGEEKKKLSKIEIRKRCRDYALKFVKIQKEEFKKLGILGDWENPYLTLNFEYEAKIVDVFGELVEQGNIYKGLKPVQWCRRCETALAEAEVEYADKESPSIYVKFPLKEEFYQRLLPEKRKFPIYVLIWTTTPWTLPANVAIAVKKEFEYVLVEIGQEILLLAKKLLKAVLEKAKITDFRILKTLTGGELKGLICRQVLNEKDSSLILGEHVTKDEGTGCVHIAPGHGQEDYELGLKYNLPVITPVDNQGKFTKEAGEFSGLDVFSANLAIAERLKKEGLLFFNETIKHSYPHCWRCKEPIIFRATEQWFISIDKKNLRGKALSEVKKVDWIPSWGEARIANMIKSRSDWCISRQRSWGIPLPIFYCKSCKSPIVDGKIIRHISSLVKKEGTDIWFSKEAEELLPPGVVCKKCQGKEFVKEKDILDVWFDSGVSHTAVCRARSNLGYPADLYVEGSDQYRGWFQSSLLTAAGTGLEAPYRTVLTHGFVNDGLGRKMSKSLGNVIAPQEIMGKYGADILRLWVSSEDYRDDLRLSDEILFRLVEAYRRIRNTFRFLLANLYDFCPNSDVKPYGELLEIDRYMLSTLEGLIDRSSQFYENYQFHQFFAHFYNYCSVDLSSFYLDILKDRLYTFPSNSTGRRAAQTVLFKILVTLVKLISPVLSFTAEDVWRHFPKGFKIKEASVFLSDWPKSEKKLLVKELEAKWGKIKALRQEAAKVIEKARRDKVIGNALEAKVLFYCQDKPWANFLKDNVNSFPSILIVSQVEVKSGIPKGPIFQSQEIKGLAIEVQFAQGKKCERCWNYSQSVGEDKTLPQICERCIKHLKAGGTGDEG